MARRRAQIIPPRSDLKRKAVNSRVGFELRITPEVIKRLEEVVHKSRDTFTEDIAKRLVAMRGQVAEVAAGAADHAEAIAAVYESSLEIKGAGGTIGYDLLTMIGKSLNDLVTGLEQFDRRQIEVIGLHIDALYAVLANRITGRGGIIESAVVEAFGEARRRVRPDPSGKQVDDHDGEA